MIKKRAMGREQWLTLGSAVLLLFVLLGNMYLNHRYFVSNFMDGDAAAEIMLAMQVAKEGRFVFSTNWYYSTELRVLHNQIIMALLFRFIQDPLVVHGVAQGIASGLLALSTVFCLRSLRLPLWAGLLASVLMITPFSHEVFYINTINSYYFFTLNSLLFIGLFAHMVRAERKTGWLVGLCVLSLLLGMAGVRYLMVLYAPVCITLFLFWLVESDRARIDPKSEPLRLGLWVLPGLLAYGVGLVLNSTLLQRWLHFSSGSGSYIFSPHGYVAEKLAVVPGVLMALLAPLEPESLISMIGLVQLFKVGFAGLMFFCAVYLLVRLKHLPRAVQYYVVFAWVSFGISFLSVVLLQDLYQRGAAMSPRFILVGMYPWLTLPVVALAVGRLREMKRVLLGLAVSVAALANVFALDTQLKRGPEVVHDTMTVECIDFLLENGYTQGFANANNACNIILRSGGKLRAVGVMLTEERVVFSPWLQPVDNLPDNEDERQFLMIRQQEYKPELYPYLDESAVIFANQNFVVLEVDPDGLL